MLFLDAIPAAALLDPDYEDASTAPIFAEILAATAALRYALVAQPYDPLAVFSLPGGPMPIAEQAILDVPDLEFMGAATPIYMRSSDSEAWLTDADDEPASLSLPPVLSPAYDIAATLGNAEDPLGPLEIKDGVVRILNASGDYDSLVRASWGGAPLEIRVNAPGIPLKSSPVVLRGTAETKAHDEGSITLGLRLRMASLASPLQLSYFKGTGGIEGPAALTNIVIPECWGECENVPLILLNREKNIHRVAVKVSQVLAVKDLGLEVTPAGLDYPDFDALHAAPDPAPGTFATCLAYGLIRPGSALTMPTADVVGPDEIGSTAISIYRHVLLSRLGPGLRVGFNGIDHGRLNLIDAERPWPIGIYIDGERSAFDVIDPVMRSIGAWPGQTRQGIFTAGLYRKPAAAGVPLTAADIEMQGLTADKELKPIREVVVNYRPIWRTMDGAEISTAADEATRELLKRPFSRHSLPLSVPDRNAGTLTLTTLLRQQIHAAELAAIIGEFRGQCLRTYKARLRGPAFRHWPGDLRRLVWDRWDLQDGKDFMVIGIEEKAGQKPVLTLLGPRMA